MEQTKRSQYVEDVEQAGSEWDADIQESEMSGKSEAERLAYLAGKPKRRIDGQTCR
jgi:hypothetical protein